MVWGNCSLGVLELNMGSPVGSLGKLDLGCGEWVYPRLEGTRLGSIWEVA